MFANVRSRRLCGFQSARWEKSRARNGNGRSMMDAKLAEECRHVNFHGSLAKPQAARDLLVGPALHDQVQDISLTAGQRIHA